MPTSESVAPLYKWLLITNVMLGSINVILLICCAIYLMFITSVPTELKISSRIRLILQFSGLFFSTHNNTI